MQVSFSLVKIFIKMRPLAFVISVLILANFAFFEPIKAQKSGFFSKFTKLPQKIKGFTLEKLESLKKAVGENKWVRLKHLFILNPHLPIMALAGHDISKDDIEVWPEWMKPNATENAELLVIDDNAGSSVSPSENCGTGICRFALNATEKHEGMHLCIHFATGFIGKHFSLMHESSILRRLLNSQY